MADPNWKPIPNNQIRSIGKIEQSEHEDSAFARRVTLVDALGEFIDSSNPLAVTATINVENLVVPIDIDSEDDDISISTHKYPIFVEIPDTLTTAAFEEIFSFTSANNKTKIISLDCTSETPTTFKLYVDGVLTKVLRSSPLERNITFLFKEHRPLTLGKIIKIEAKVDRLIQTSYDTFVSMEGYIKN